MKRVRYCQVQLCSLCVLVVFHAAVSMAQGTPNIVAQYALTDGTQLGCLLSDGAYRLGVLKDGSVSLQALREKEKRLRAKTRKLTQKMKAAKSATLKRRLRQRRAGLRNVLNQIKSYRHLCSAGGLQPTPTPTPVSGVGAIIADHTSVLAYESIPAAVRSAIQTQFRVFYGHTSHGSQIMTGLQVLAGKENPPIYQIFREHSGDLGHNGDTAWVGVTRNFLDNHPNYNVVMWSWCGGVSDNSASGINTYLNAMSQLERDYLNVVFVYMTGHLDGSGESGNLRVRNRQIRDYCRQSNKVLFDFEDIESFDPSGTYYANGSDACEWCSTWCLAHTCPSCAWGGCAHSHCFNCYQKAKAWWWMMARLTGWEGWERGVRRPM